MEEGAITSISAVDAHHILLHKLSAVAGSSLIVHIHWRRTVHHTHHVWEEAHRMDQAHDRRHRAQVDTHHPWEVHEAVREEAESGSCHDENSNRHVEVGSGDGSRHRVRPYNHGAGEGRDGHHNSHLEVGSHRDGKEVVNVSGSGHYGLESPLESR